jgi:hypothetical protein
MLQAYSKTNVLNDMYFHVQASDTVETRSDLSFLAALVVDEPNFDLLPYGGLINTYKVAIQGLANVLLVSSSHVTVPYTASATKSHAIQLYYPARQLTESNPQIEWFMYMDPGA